MALNTTLPTLYEHYTEGGLQEGLSTAHKWFTLNGRNISLYSGAMHYFRVPREYWRDRLRKMRAAGLNTVETYVPWNLHEPQPGTFDFGDGGSDMEDFLHLEEFLETAREEDLLAIVRPGPYICAEWEFGGFPSWLLRDKDTKLRTSDEKYMVHVRRYFNVLLPLLAALQFTKGGPIVAFQVENEYGSTKSTNFKPDKKYLKQLRNIFLDNNITELLFTSDGVVTFGTAGTLPEYFLVTANFDGSPNESFAMLDRIQPNRPKMAMEFYPGWFDHWSEEHNTRDVDETMANLEEILRQDASFNLYMMHGGTSFGFMNGANLNNRLADNSGFQPDTTSYDYDAVLTEAGDYTEKYERLAKLLDDFATPKTRLPDRPEPTPRIAYANVTMSEFLSVDEVLAQQPIKIVQKELSAMEMLPINNNSGQSYGYLVYRKENVRLEANSTLQISGHVCDTVVVFVNGKLVSAALQSTKDLDGFGFWRLKDSTLVLNDSEMDNVTLDLVVENWGRVNYGKLSQYNQLKGLWQGDVLLNNETLNDWTHIPLQMKKRWSGALRGWQRRNTTGPGFYRGVLTVSGTTTASDTYVDMRQWTKGVLLVNGFVVGRYARIGPQQCLFLPAPFLKDGRNELLVFEHYSGDGSGVIAFSQHQIYETVVAT